MKIKWLAHAAFLITADSGTRIITDPYKVEDNLKHSEIKEASDIVTISHAHSDHNNVAAVRGNPRVVQDTSEVKDIKIKSIPTAHDDTGGTQRGKNTVFCFEVDGINVCHTGDLGHLLTEEQAAAIGKVDVLILPVGGHFTIDAKAAGRVCDQLKPKVIIPMHFKTDKVVLPIAGVDVFLEGKNNVTRSDGSEIELKAGDLPDNARIIVLKPAL